METKNKFYIFTISCYELLGLGLAIRLQNEGYDTTLGLIEPELEEDTFDVKDDGYKKKMEFLEKTGTGLIKKEWAKTLIPKIYEEPKESTYIIFDLDYGYIIADAFRKSGYKVLNASKIGNKLEKDRDGTLQLLKKMGIDSPNKMKFGKGQVDKAIEFLEERDELYVLKSDNLDVITMVAEQSNEELIDKLMAEKKDIDKEPFLLQERVEGIEGCTETWYYDGKPMFSNMDIEVKDKYNSISPPQCGCAYDLNFPIDLDSKVRMETNAKMDAFVKKYMGKGAVVLDLAWIYNRAEKKYWALEVCGSRFGYNGTYCLLATVPNVGQMFMDWMDGKEIEGHFHGYGASLRIFNDGEKKDVMVNIPDEFEDNIWLWDAYKKGGKIYTSGNESVGMISCAGENPESAFAKCTEVFEKMFMSTKFIRDDYFDIQNAALPLARYSLLKHLKMFETYVRPEENKKGDKAS